LWLSTAVKRGYKPSKYTKGQLMKLRIFYFHKYYEISAEEFMSSSHMTSDSSTKISTYVPLCFEYGQNMSECEHERDGFLVKAKFSPQIIYVSSVIF